MLLQFDIVSPGFVEVGEFVGGQVAFDAGGGADGEYSRRDHGTGRNESAGTDDRLLADAGMIHHYCSHTDQALPFDVAAVQRDAMSDGDLLCEDGRAKIRADVDHRHVLNIGACADANVADIAANDAAEPHVRILTDLDITYHDHIFGNVGRFVDLWVDVVECFDHLISLTLVRAF